MASNATGKGEAKVRISKTLSEGEKAATAARKEEVKKGLGKLGIPYNEDQIPNIAVLGSGGAVRAMIALYGTLAELKKYNLLDCVMYLGGVSGSTWCISALYKHEDWTEKMEALEKSQRETLVKGQWEFQKAMKAVIGAAEDECYSLTDFWSYFLVHKLLNELDESELSVHRGACENGKNPYPIYTAVDKQSYEQQHAGTWFEFTPHEAGVPGLGAYVDMKHFGSIFENGQLTEEKKKRNICYLQGLWGSALGSEQELYRTIIESLLNYLKQKRSGESSSTSTTLDQDDQKLKALYEGYQSVLELHLCETSGGRAADKHFDHLRNILESHGTSRSFELLREICKTWFSANAETRKKDCMRLCQALDLDFGGFASDSLHVLHDVVRKTYLCLLNWTWGSTNNFLYHCSDVECPDLTSKQVVSLIDAGLLINTAYPSLLQSQRKVKLILSFDFSAGDPFLTIKKAIKYCEEHGIPFPKIDEKQLQDTDDLKDCYIFRGDAECVPTVVHCPLFNKVNCSDKIHEYREQFSTFKMSYSKEEIEKLLTAAKQNVANVHEKILEEIKNVVCPPS
ncbi:cytosolic phospholipase A2 gamma [Zootoca vivipara]|uniref:cytosolic phospholipase A2 gamma n=1 Tax=Zootoca vivipara TaxID=8524 RepID=UPI00293B94BE|nr:cytosolic phospholipase A2 gamma [Zootoca vivipara]